MPPARTRTAPAARKRSTTPRKPATGVQPLNARRSADTPAQTPSPQDAPDRPGDRLLAAPESGLTPTARRVVIDGVEYAPCASPSAAGPSVGIAITTHNRPALLAQVVENLKAHTPSSFPIFVVDDGTEGELPVKPTYRFDDPVGVAGAKNKALELLIRSGVDHLFLFDDDCWPTVDDWWRGYLESPEPHLAHSWKLIKLWSDERHNAWHASGGTVLYYTREVILDVGGMRTDFGEPGQPAWGCEHVNLSDRIFNRGHTTWRYADVAEADALFRELDREPGHKSTATERQKNFNRSKGRELWINRIETDDAYVEFRDLDQVILTCLFTGSSAANSKRGYTADVKLLKALAESITHGRLVVFHDQLNRPQLTTGNGQPVEFVKTPCKINVFFQRHQTYWQWLRDHPEVGQVWAVDGTDVTQLRDPFAPLADNPGKLHLGWEPTVLGGEWFTQQHPERRVQQFLAEHAQDQVLNPGVIGGDRSVVMEYLHGLIRYYYDVQIDHAQVWQPRNQAKVGQGDMAAANMIAYQRFAPDRLVTGSRITTVFKAYEAADKNSWSLWSHK